MNTSGRIINKEELLGFLEGSLRESTLYAPVTRGGVTGYEPVKNASEISLDFSNSLKPVKEIFYPQKETLFEYDRGKGITRTPITGESRILFGVRPCDVRSLLILDMVFEDSYGDPYYLAMRKSTVIVGLSCTKPESTCLCTSFGSHPAAIDGMDALVTQLDETSFFVEAKTERGKSFFESLGRPSDEKSEKDRGRVIEAAANAISSRFELPAGIDDLETIFTSVTWEKESRRCISCAICRYLCPTCYCFSLADSDAKRIKHWDACNFAHFTKEASGENPRALKSKRFKQWYYHKFSYFKKDKGTYLCTGCGRCIANCPMNIDFTEVIRNAGSIRS